MKLFSALRFLTILPLPGSSEETLEDIARSSPYYPVVGIFIGILLSLIALIPLWSPYASAVLILALWVIITGGLHLDGAADLADGWAGGRTRENRLRVMSDSRIGAFGVIALVVLLLVKLMMIAELLISEMVFLLPLVPMTARLMAVAAIRLFPPARSGGMGSVFKSSCRTSHLFSAALFTLLLAWLIAGLPGLLLVILTGLIILTGCLRVSRKLGGLTGDVYGAVIEYSEVITLVLIIPLWEVI